MSILAGNRKFYICLIVVAASLGLRISGLIEDSSFTDILKTIVVAYMGTNIGEHAVKMLEIRRK